MSNLEATLLEPCSKCGNTLPRDEVWVLEMVGARYQFCSERCFKTWCKRKGIEL